MGFAASAPRGPSCPGKMRRWHGCPGFEGLVRNYSIRPGPTPFQVKRWSKRLLANCPPRHQTHLQSRLSAKIFLDSLPFVKPSIRRSVWTSVFNHQACGKIVLPYSMAEFRRVDYCGAGARVSILKQNFPEVCPSLAVNNPIPSLQTVSGLAALFPSSMTCPAYRPAIRSRFI